MPYDPSHPPEKVKHLPPKKQRQWISVFNSCWDRNPGDEAKCHAMAWGVVKKASFDREMVARELTAVARLMVDRR